MADKELVANTGLSAESIAAAGEYQRRISDLESRLTFMEVTIEALDSVVTKQHDLIDAMREQLKTVLIQMGGSNLSKDNEPPPHY